MLKSIEFFAMHSQLPTAGRDPSIPHREPTNLLYGLREALQMLIQASSIGSIRTVLWNHRTSLSSVLACFRTSILTVERTAYAEFIGATATHQHVVSLVVIKAL